MIEKKLIDENFLQSLKDNLWVDAETRACIESAGVNITPCNFYSSTPSLADIEHSFEYNEDVAPYLLDEIFEPKKMETLLEELCQYSSEFSPETHGDEDHCKNFFWGNSQFSYSDAMAYFAFIRHYKPKNIIEIGSGFSSLVALEALQKNGVGSLTCIEPYPRTFLENRQDLCLKKIRAQDVSEDFLNGFLNDGDILFIDSTHTVKTGSDCLHIYLRLLPKIKKNIYVHVHDIFLPFGMPKNWLLDHHIYWVEQYLLLAFLIDNPKISVLFGSAYHHAFNPQLLEQFMCGMPAGGGSFWFKYSGRSIENSIVE